MIETYEDVTVREITVADSPVWESLRCELWPGSPADHAKEIAMFFAGTLEEPVAVLMAENVAGTTVAFAELSIRTDVTGLEGKRVGYVEGLYVKPEFRRQGIARKLLVASRNWARQRACDGFASDRAERPVIDRTY